jgi:hypothetical protein
MSRANPEHFAQIVAQVGADHARNLWILAPQLARRLGGLPDDVTARMLSKLRGNLGQRIQLAQRWLREEETP